jgi:hypothetical protein
MEREKDGLDQFRKWLVPILLSLITVLGGILGGNVMDAIKALNVKVDAINQIINKQSVMDRDLDNLKEKVMENKNNIEKIREDLDQHMMYSGDVAIKEAEKRLKRK